MHIFMKMRYFIAVMMIIFFFGAALPEVQGGIPGPSNYCQGAAIENIQAGSQSLPASPSPGYPPQISPLAPPSAYRPVSPPSSGPPVVPPTPPSPGKGVINPFTGEFYPGTLGGVVNPRTGEVLPKVEGGYYNPRTGEFIPQQ